MRPLSAPSVGRGRTRVPPAGGGGGGSNAYPHFPAFDMSLFPPHLAGGAWGTQRAVQVAATPVTNSSGTAGTNAQFIDAVQTPGTQVTLTDIIDGATAATAPIRDVDVISPEGTGIFRSFLGQSSGLQDIERLRIRGPNLGEFGGGQLHDLRMFGPGRDVIIECLNASSPGGNNGALRIARGGSGQIDRLAINKIRANCGGYFLLCNANDPVVTGCSVLTAQDTTSPVEAWGTRYSIGTLGTVIEFGNDFRASTARAGSTNNTYHRSRRHPDPGARYSWHYGNVYIDRVQARIFLIDAAFGSGTGTLDACWFLNNLIIATYASGANGRDLNINDALYGRVNGNTFQSDQFTSVAQILFGAPVVDNDKTGNIFQALPGSDPSWLAGTPGDPSVVNRFV